MQYFKVYSELVLVTVGLIKFYNKKCTYQTDFRNDLPIITFFIFTNKVSNIKKTSSQVFVFYSNK